MNEKQLEIIKIICSTYETLAKELRSSIESVINNTNNSSETEIKSMIDENNKDLILINKKTKRIVFAGNNKRDLLNFLYDTKEISITPEASIQEIAELIICIDYELKFNRSI